MSIPAPDGGSAPARQAASSVSSAGFAYPFAAAPDIIRSHQKDAYFSAVLSEQVTDAIRLLFGARTAHSWAAGSRAAAELIYFGLTTVVGNRTLGEEYCDIVQVEEDTGRLASLQRRAGFVITSVLAPYTISWIMPGLRSTLKQVLATGLDQPEQQMAKDKKGRRRQSPVLPAVLLLRRIQRYLLANLDSITSTGPVYAVSLSLFYFTGAYYHFGKRLFRLRYLFTRATDVDSAGRAGYEVLGVLLALQLIVQAYFHVRDTLAGRVSDESRQNQLFGSDIYTTGQRDVSLDPNRYAENNALLPGSSAGAADSGASAVERLLHTPVLEEGNAHINLADTGTMGWIAGRQERQCTLCLDPMRDPAVTTCGHVFCWSCIADWCREKTECPLCRQSCLSQHLLPLRG